MPASLDAQKPAVRTESVAAAPSSRGRRGQLILTLLAKYGTLLGLVLMIAAFSALAPRRVPRAWATSSTS